MNKTKLEIKMEIATQVLNGFIVGHGAAYKSMNLGDDALLGYINLSKLAANTLYDELIKDNEGKKIVQNIPHEKV